MLVFLNQKMSRNIIHALIIQKYYTRYINFRNTFKGVQINSSHNGRVGPYNQCAQPNTQDIDLIS